MMHTLAGCPQGMLGDPQRMAEMMNNPLVQGLLSDPEMVRTILQSNPAIREVCVMCRWEEGTGRNRGTSRAARRGGGRGAEEPSWRMPC